MKTRILLSAALAMLIGHATVATGPAAETVDLLADGFNGWTRDLAKKDVTIPEVWSLDDGVLTCKGQPYGVLRTEKEYGDYVLELEWRWPNKGGNNGVLVHTGDPRTLGIWPRSLEVQLAHRNAGDFWDIGTETDMPGEDARRSSRRVANLTDDSEKPLGEWNHMRIRCQNDTVTVWVNGDEVNACTNLRNAKTGEPLTSGAICLQSEGTPIEYRNVCLTPIEK
jgi:hypothetical protein